MTVRSNCLLADKLVVVRMGTDPEPLNAIVNIVAKRSIVPTNSDGPQWSDPFEMQRRVPLVGLKYLVVLVRESSDLRR
jgi:hypothetical protein